MSVALLTTIRDETLASLAADTSPQADYSLDGESVSREAWRTGMLQRVKELNELIQQEQPFEIRSMGL